MKKIQDYQTLLKLERDNEYMKKGIKLDDDRTIDGRKENKPTESLGTAIVNEIQNQFQRQLEMLQR